MRSFFLGTFQTPLCQDGVGAKIGKMNWLLQHYSLIVFCRYSKVWSDWWISEGRLQRERTWDDNRDRNLVSSLCGIATPAPISSCDGLAVGIRETSSKLLANLPHTQGWKWPKQAPSRQFWWFQRSGTEERVRLGQSLPWVASWSCTMAEGKGWKDLAVDGYDMICANVSLVLVPESLVFDPIGLHQGPGTLL